MYFNYHAKIQKLVKEKHVVCFEYVDEYHGIAPCLLIYCDDGKIFPIRQHRFDEYEFLLVKYDIPQK